MTMENTRSPAVHVITVPRFERKHIVAIVLCLAGAAAALYIFWKDLNLILERLYEEPLGIVIHKRHIAQRRFTDRTLWDRLRRQSPLYSGDYIRTAELSGALLSLSGEELVNLEEHTIIQILRTAEGSMVELSEGNLQVDTGSGGLIIKAGDKFLRAGQGSVLSAAAKDGQGGITAENAVPGPAVDASPPNLISPVPEELFSFGTSRPGIRFVWTANAGAGSYLVEISPAPGMADSFYRVQVQDSGGSLASIVCSGFEAGTWYWRVTPEYPRNYTGTAQPSQIRSFRIERTESLGVPVQQFPVEKKSLYLEDAKQEVYFSWKQEADAASYTFLLSRRENLTDPLIKQRVSDNYFACNFKGGLSAGEYYWGVYQTDMNGRDSVPSAARSIVVVAGPPPENSFTAETPGNSPSSKALESGPGPAALASASAPLPAPDNLRPAPGHVLTESVIIRDKQLAFSWNAVSGASSYVFILYQGSGGGRREVLRRILNEPRFTLRDLAVLDAGTFVWRVEGVSSPEGQKNGGAESSFTVSIAEIEASEGQESGVMFGTE
jgi:hypothetical protein